MRPRDRRAVVLAAIGAVGLLLTSLPVALGSPSDIEVDVFRAINRLPDGLHLFLGSVGQLGNLLVVPAAVLVAIGFGRWRLALGLAVAGMAAYLLSDAIKQVFGQERPEEFLANVVVRGPSQEGLGYVSGHAAVATALATVLAPRLHRARWVLAIAVTLVCISRVYVGAHLPLDVIGAVFLGLTIGAGVRFALHHLDPYPPRQPGRVRPAPRGRREPAAADTGE
jgi:membrane-associated phospholipid phosphatase